MNSKLYIKINLVVLLNCIAIITNAQTSNYTFTQGVFSAQSQYYVSVDASPNPYYAYQKILHPPNSSANPLKTIYTGSDTGSIAAYATGNGYPIGFNFIYNGESFDRVAVSGNGYIKLGRTGQPITIKNDTLPGTIFDGSSYHQNILASFQTAATIFYPQTNSSNRTSLCMYGLPGNRTFVAYFSIQTPSGVLLTHQIQLQERNNLIEFAYDNGGIDYPNILLQAAVGITGNSDFSNLKVVTGVNTWQTAVRESVSTDFCDFNGSVLPPGTGSSSSSFMYIWTPPTPTPSVPACPFTYFLSADTTIFFPAKNNILSGGATTAYAAYTYYMLADGATVAPNNPTLSWSDQSIASSQATTYDVFLDTDNPPQVLVAQNLSTTSYTLPILAPNTKYYYNVVSKNASGKDSVCIGSFTTSSIPQYCNIIKTSGYINSLTVNTLSFVASSANDLGPLPATAPYITTLKRDTGYICSVTLVGQISGAPWSRADVRGWIDFNQDGDFDDPGEALTGGSAGVNGSFTFNIPIPNTAKLGQTIMRIASKNVADNTTFAPCANYFLGADEDFIITIAPSTSCKSFNINPIITNVNCHGQSNGNINLNAIGGATPYIINWTNGNSSDEITNLTKGIYQATITDANGCEVATPLIPVLQPSVLSIDTARDSNNAIHILAAGGTNPYTYLWSNDSTSSVSNNFTSGTYSVKVTDAHGCDTTMQNIVVSNTTIIPPPPPPPPVDSVTVTDSSININVYPNPNTGTIYLQSQKQQYLHVEIVSEQGKIMNDGYYTIGNGNATPVNIATYPGGIYFLKIIGDKSTRVVKIIKVLK
jgi:hypothetical protein